MKKFSSIALVQIILMIVAVMVFTAGCRTTTFDKVAARKEIESADSLFIDLLNKSDATGLADCYTADAMLMMAHAPAIEGSTNIQSAMMEFITSGATKMSVRINNTWGDEETLISEGTAMFATKEGQVVDRGKYITVYKKEDGRWKMFRDCFNSDLPLVAAK